MLKPFFNEKNQEKSVENKDVNITQTSTSGATQTLEIPVQKTVETKSFVSYNQKTIDKEGKIPNGIMKVFRSQKRVKIFNITATLILLIASAILFTLFVLKPSLINKEVTKAPIIWYILLTIFDALVLWKLINDSIELHSLKMSIREYRHSIEQGTNDVPSFVLLLYRKLSLNQVTQNWITIATVFYLGVFTLIFWALKDQQWIKKDGVQYTDGSGTVYLLDFKRWISESFPNPVFWVTIFCVIILCIVVLHIVFTIMRKAKLSSIQSFMGSGSLDYNQVAQDKQSRNRLLAKIFFLSILVILVIPFIVYFIAKRIVIRKK
ncbi:MSC_0882 family membrane protein [[Mycoplasma] gypis]|uniref:Uncharacterized protein n=1 Tax=[Mycoplasma] gypis TaxID=92404 RepID=A0ABZ2RTT7_9BACT|nr:hypothetical protein [[Mycoplasma] gypis]MBN0919350.1 hypothetical protein [[Mycoplasma] gypis]